MALHKRFKKFSASIATLALVASALAGSVFFTAPTVFAGTGIGTTVTLPTPVIVGDINQAASIQFVNTSTGADAVDPVTISSVTLSTTGGNTGVFSLSGSGTQAGGTTCGAANFTITPGAPGTWAISPNIVLQPVGVNGTCQINFTFNVLAFPSADDNGGLAGTQVFLSVTGNALNNVTQVPGNAAGTGQTTVNKATPTVTTHIHNANHQDITNTTTTPGTLVHDQATVTGSGPTPTGTVDFIFFNNSTCSGSSGGGTSGVALVAGVAESSAMAAPVGGLSYIAHYNGDANYMVADGVCEPLNVAKLDPSVITHVRNASGTDITYLTVPQGTVVYDEVTVSGNGGTPTGTADFMLFTNGTCSGNASSTQSGVALVAGTASSDAFTPGPGSYSYLVHYNGDGTYNAGNAACEPFTIEQPRLQWCSHGYWKQPHHFDSWVTYSPNQLFSSVFENAFPGKTLLQVMQQGGGGLNALGRDTVGELLNTSAGLYTGWTTSGIISAFNSVYPGTKSEYSALHSQFVAPENCPLN